MLEVIAVGYLLSVLTIVMVKSGRNFGLLDPFGAKMTSIYMLAVILSLVNLMLLARG